MDKRVEGYHDSAELGALISSRICHDLISPIGAIGNGLELMGLAQVDPTGPEMALVTESCNAAQARIRFFRVAFGSGLSEQPISSAEARAILSDFAQGGRQHPRWDVEADLPRTELQLALLAYLCFETAMPHGGEVHITRQDGSWRLEARDVRLSVNPDLWSGLTGTPNHGTLAPAHVQFALLPRIAADRGRAISVRHGETTLGLQV